MEEQVLGPCLARQCLLPGRDSDKILNSVKTGIGRGCGGTESSEEFKNFSSRKVFQGLKPSIWQNLGLQNFAFAAKKN